MMVHQGYVNEDIFKKWNSKAPGSSSGIRGRHCWTAFESEGLHMVVAVKVTQDPQSQERVNEDHLETNVNFCRLPVNLGGVGNPWLISSTPLIQIVAMLHVLLKIAFSKAKGKTIRGGPTFLVFIFT